MRNVSSIALTLAALSAMPLTARAAQITWDGSDSTDFELGANWVGNAVPNPYTYTSNTLTSAGDIATFSGTSAGVNQPQLSTPTRSLGGILFNSTGWTLGTASNTVTVLAPLVGASGGIAAASASGTNTISANVAVAVRDASYDAFNIGTGSTVSITGNVSTVLAGATGSLGQLRKVGAGTLQLSGTGSISRFTLIAGKVEVLAGQGGVGNNGASLTIGSGATYDVIGADINANTLALNAGGTLTSSSVATRTFSTRYDSDSTLAGTISGNLNIVHKLGGAGRTVTVSGVDNSYTGSTRIDSTMALVVSKLANGGENSSIGASSNAATNLQLNAGTLRYVGGTTTTDRNFSITTTSGIAIESSGSGALTWTGSLTPLATGNTSLTLGGTNTDLNNFSGTLNNASGRVTSITKAGAGTWTLTGVSNYSGATLIDGGTLVVNTLAAAGTSSSIGASTVANVNSNSQLKIGGTLRYVGAGSTTNRLFTLNSAATPVGLESSGSGAVSFTNLNALGTLIQQGGIASNYSTGATTVTVRDASKLVVGMGIANGNGSIPDGTYITAIAGNVVTLSSAATAGSDTGQTVTFVGGPRNLAMGGTNTDQNTIASIIVDPAATFAYGTGRTATSNLGSNLTSVTKSGAGTWRLTAANTYTGGTTVTDGLLLLANTVNSATGSGAVLVTAGTLGGTGTANGTTTIGNGSGTADAVIAPGIGNIPGQLTVGALALNSDAVAQLQLNSDTALADRIVSPGAINLGAGIAALELTDLGSTELLIGSEFTLFSSTTGVSGYFAGLAPISGSLSDTFLVGANGFNLDYRANSVVAVVAVVPEPSAVALLGSIGLLALNRRRRR